MTTWEAFEARQYINYVNETLANACLGSQKFYLVEVDGRKSVYIGTDYYEGADKVMSPPLVGSEIVSWVSGMKVAIESLKRWVENPVVTTFDKASIFIGDPIKEEELKRAIRIAIRDVREVSGVLESEIGISVNVVNYISPACLQKFHMMGLVVYKKPSEQILFLSDIEKESSFPFIVSGFIATVWHIRSALLRVNKWKVIS